MKVQIFHIYKKIETFWQSCSLALTSSVLPLHHIYVSKPPGEAEASFSSIRYVFRFFFDNGNKF